MARASIRWIGLLVSLIAALVILTSIFSPDTVHSAQGVAQEWRDKFHDNAGPGGINDKLSEYAPRVYDQVQSWWSRLFPDAAELRGLQPEEEFLDDNVRCRVYTYYDTTSKSEDTEALLQVWLKAWWAMGMYPIILTDEMSMKHPQYASLHTKYADVGLDLQRIDAMLAMDHLGYEGMLTASHVFPMAPIDDAMLIQMRQCKVLDVLTKYRSARDDIMRGSNMAYKIVVQALVDYKSMVDVKRVGVLGIEGVPGANFRELEDTKTFAVYDAATVAKLYPDLYAGKSVTQGGKSFSFAKNQLASLVDGHLQDNFLKNHRRGIEVLRPNLDNVDSDYLSRASMRLALELMRCNLTPLPQTCAPQHTDSLSKCFDCRSLVSSAFIKPTEGFEPKNATFFVGNVPHPLTLLAFVSDTSEPSGADVRKSQRDLWSRKSLTTALVRHAGAIQGLIFLSDSLWKNEDSHLPDAHIWQTFEEGRYADIEYDVGFSLPELQANLDQLSQTAKEKSKEFQEKVTKLQGIVKAPTGASQMKAIEMTEAWSQYDAGAHQLIGNYVKYKEQRLQAMKRANQNVFVVLDLK